MMSYLPEYLRLRSVPELLDATFSLYRQHFFHFIGLIGAMYVPLGLLGASISALFFGGEMLGFGQAVFAAGEFSPAQILAVSAGSILIALLSFVLTTFALAAAFRSIEARVRGERPSVAEAYRMGLPRVPALLGTRILYYLIMGLLFLPAGVLMGIGAALVADPASGDAAAGGGAALFLAAFGLGAVAGLAVLVLLPWFQFHPQAAVLERLGPVASLRRSFRLVRGAWLRVLGMIIAIWLFQTVLSLTPSALAMIPTGLIFDPSRQFQFWPLLISSVVSTLTQVLILPIGLIAGTLLYYDVRSRKEGFDLETAVAQVMAGA